jgi:hypothetical protein
LRPAGYGRWGEIANGCFVDLQFAESGFGWLTGRYGKTRASRMGRFWTIRKQKIARFEWLLCGFMVPEFSKAMNSVYRKNKDHDRIFETGDFLPVSKMVGLYQQKKCAYMFNS